jgi:hypothetical protein
VNAASASDYFDGAFANLKCVQNGNTIGITATSPDGLTAFTITLAPETATAAPSGLEAVVVSTQVGYSGPNSPTLLRAKLPNVQTFQVPGSNANAMAMVPQEMGSVLPLSNLNAAAPWDLGASYLFTDQRIGLPVSFNVMEVAEVYDPNGNGGLFFTDLDGDFSRNIPPLQFTVTATGAGYSIAGYWTARLKPSETVTFPRMAIGVHPSGDWHEAADYYVSRRQGRWTFPDTPRWFREAGGIYMVGIAGGGSFIGFPVADMVDDQFGIQSFACNSTSLYITEHGGTQSFSPPNKPGERCLLDALADAQSLGSNILYLTEPYRADPGTSNYGSKGDYVIRTDLGGAAGLADGVRQVHAAGGQVILYVESYLVDHNADLITSGPGLGWQGVPDFPLPAGTPAGICMYAPGICMAEPNSQWQDYLISRAQSLVQQTGIDGIFLDSAGWQMNRPVYTTSEDVGYSSQEWSAAMLRMVDRIRTAIRVYNPEAIVMGESNSGQLPFHWDGGSAADLGFASVHTVNDNHLPASPVRYALPQTNYFANSGEYRGLNQVLAAGHNLALGAYWLLGPLPSTYSFTSTPLPRNPAAMSYIQSLVHARIQYKDALIYGRQVPIPGTNSPSTEAFLYQGTENQVLTIANADLAAMPTVSVQLPAGMGGTVWTNLPLVPGSLATPVTASPTGLLTLPGGLPGEPQALTDPLGGVAILVRMAPGPFPATYPISQTVHLMNEDFGDGTMNHWTVSSGQWSASVLFPGLPFLSVGQMNVQSLAGQALAFYDLYGGQDFTYSALITLDSATTGGWAGLGFRLSDNPPSDEANQGYLAVLGSAGVQILTRPGNTVLGTAPFPVIPELPYLFTVTAAGQSISVSVDGIRVLAVTDGSFVSGRFGVSSYDANAHFTGLLANDQ